MIASGTTGLQNARGPAKMSGPRREREEVDDFGRSVAMARDGYRHNRERAGFPRQSSATWSSASAASIDGADATAAISRIPVVLNRFEQLVGGDDPSSCCSTAAGKLDELEHVRHRFNPLEIEVSHSSTERA